MKKIFSFIVVCAIGMVAAISANAGERIAPTQVPAAMQAFVTSNFGQNVSIAAAERDRKGSNYEYDMMLTNGFKIEFGANGEWTEVEGPQVPASILGEAIADYVSANYPYATVKKIERKRYGYEVDLNNGLELKFDKNCIFKNASR